LVEESGHFLYRPSYSQFCVKISQSLLPWQQAFVGDIKLADPENPHLVPKSWNYPYGNRVIANTAVIGEQRATTKMVKGDSKFERRSPAWLPATLSVEHASSRQLSLYLTRFRPLPTKAYITIAIRLRYDYDTTTDEKLTC